MRDLAYWNKIVAGSTRGIPQEQIADIAKMCLDAEAKGENFAVWHQTSIYFGQKCNCRQCAA